jgi:hypothetical protein
VANDMSCCIHAGFYVTLLGQSQWLMSFYTFLAYGKALLTRTHVKRNEERNAMPIPDKKHVLLASSTGRMIGAKPSHWPSFGMCRHQPGAHEFKFWHTTLAPTRLLSQIPTTSEVSRVLTSFLFHVDCGPADPWFHKKFCWGENVENVKKWKRSCATDNSGRFCRAIYND